MPHRLLNAALLIAIFASPRLGAPQAATSSVPAISGPKVLSATEASTFLPSAVYFRGQSASVQTRNSGGVQFSKDALLLVTLVDTSGYSNSLQQKYQAYLLTEVPIDISGHRLEPGAYGCGFVANDSFIVMDIGAHDLFSVHSTHDADIHRPTPLQVVTVPGDANKYRLYMGRNFVDFGPIRPGPQ